MVRDQVAKFNRVVGTSFQSKDLKVKDLGKGAYLEEECSRHSEQLEQRS